MRYSKRELYAVITTFLCILLMFQLFSIKLSYGLPQSVRVALVPDSNGEAWNGGYLWEGPFPNGDTFTFVNVDPYQIASNATDPIVAGGFDTVVFVQLSTNWWNTYPTFASRIMNFVTDGGKLIIYDSEMTTQDYSTFIYPFTVSAPGAQGSSNGTLWIVENCGLGSNVTADYAYVNTALIGSQTEIGDANVMVTANSNWKAHMYARNLFGVIGPVHTYAEYGKGLIIWNGQDMDPFDYTAFTGIDNSDGPDALGMIWYLELKQGFDPTNPPLRGQISVAGLSLTPVNATNPIKTLHTITARVTNANTSQPIANVAVDFSITAGPNTGISGTANTDAMGEATFSWSSTVTGTDTVTAYVRLFNRTIQAQAFKTWTGNQTVSPPNAQLWMPAIVLASAMFASMIATGLAIILIAEIARRRRKRKRARA